MMAKVVPDMETRSNEDVPKPGDPGYFRYLTKAIFVVGINKCITPSVLLLAAMVFLFVDIGIDAQDCLEQMAGGLLIYTWGAKCMVPIQEAFKTAFVECKDPKWPSWVLPVCGFGSTIVFIFAPLFYLATEGNDFSSVQGGIWMYGVVPPNSEPECNDDGTRAANSTQACLARYASRPGLATSQTCDGGSDDGGGFADLLPYFMGFALDAIMLILVEPEEDLVKQYAKIRASYKDCIVDLLVAPLAFSLDNFLTGAGVSTVVLAAAGGSKGGAVGIFFIFAFCTAFGVLIAFVIRAFEEFLSTRGLRPLALWFKFSFLLWVALSFLDNGSDLVKSGLTFWVGMGGAVGWMLYVFDCIMASGET